MMEVGLYFRVEREGKFLTLDLTQMTRDEIGKILEGKDEAWKDSMLMMVVGMVLGLSSRLNEEGK